MASLGKIYADWILESVYQALAEGAEGCWGQGGEGNQEESTGDGGWGKEDLCQRAERGCKREDISHTHSRLEGKSSVKCQGGAAGREMDEKKVTEG